MLTMIDWFDALLRTSWIACRLCMCVVPSAYSEVAQSVCVWLQSALKRAPLFIQMSLRSVVCR